MVADLSVVVPIYNVEKYLRECIDSILKQSIQPKEIILVNDGSPDNCALICEYYKSNYDNVKVIHQENQGLSAARNAGTKLATSKYITYIDSDDFYYNSNLFQTVFNNLECNPDLVLYQRSKYCENENRIEENTKDYIELDSELSVGEKFYFIAKNNALDASAALKFIRREFIVENKIEFVKGIYSEDVDWFLSLSKKLNKCVFLNERGYAYRYRSDSISHNIKEKNIDDLIFTIKKHAEAIQKTQIDDYLQKALIDYIGYQYYIILGYLGLPRFKHIKKDRLNSLKKYSWVLREPICPKNTRAHKLYKICFCNLDLTSFALGKYMKLKEKR